MFKFVAVLCCCLPLMVKAQIFAPIATDRLGVTMNIVMLSPPPESKTALLVIPGTDGAEGRIMLRGSLAPERGAMQYLYANADLFEKANITLVATGCPTDEWKSYGMCMDAYRKSDTYAQDFSKIIQFLKETFQFEKFYVFGHSSGGISTRWLSVKIPSQLSGIINSSIMNGTAGSLANSTLGFDMRKITVPMLNIAHEADQCPSTPYFIVKNYAKDNLVTVKGGSTNGPVCGGANHHSFEGRQRGVSRAIVKWITTGEVQAVVDSDE